MKRLITLITFFLTFIASANAQNWQWAKSGGGINRDYGEDICVDNNGNVYISGLIMYPSVTFDTNTLTVNGFDDVYLAKYGASGQLKWIKRFGGPNSTFESEYPFKMIYDSVSNSLYFTGCFITSCDFGAFHLSTSTDDRQIFVSKFDTDGNCLWAKSLGGSGIDACWSLATDENKNVYISGAVQNGGTFDTISIAAGNFIAKYSESGNCSYAKNVLINCFSTDLRIFNNDIFILGQIYDSIASIDTINFNLPNYHYRFIARFDTAGNVKWAKCFGGPYDNGSFEFSIDKWGNCYIPGVIYGSYATFNNDSIFSTYPYAYYLAKFDQNGNTKWVKQGNVSGGAETNGIYCTKMNDIYLSGYFWDSISFGSYQLASPTQSDLYIARYDSSGNCIGVIYTGAAQGHGVTCDNNGYVYLTGEFYNTTDFGGNIITSIGGGDAFTAKVQAFTGLNTVNKSPEKNELFIYANPNTGKCNITVPEEFLNEDNLVLSIYNLNGQVIQQQTLTMSQDKVLLNLEAEAKGIYTATLSNGKKVYTGKIVIE